MPSPSILFHSSARGSLFPWLRFDVARAIITRGEKLRRAPCLAASLHRAPPKPTEPDQRRHRDRSLDGHSMEIDFLNALGHELRTPLALISGYLDLVLDLPEKVEPCELPALLAEARANARLMAALLNDLTDVARATTGDLHLNAEPFNLSRVLRAVAASFQAVEGGHRITLDLQSDSLIVRADEVRTRQVIGNLLSNALKYAPTGDICVSAALTTDWRMVIVGVTDRGPGIPREEQGKVWQRYFRARGASRSPAPGTGIGLAVVKALVEAQGGRVTLKSRPGAGSTFLVTLPLASPHPRSTRHPPTTPVLQVPGCQHG